MFKNKVALITGASRGIGQEIAIALAKQQCKVVLLAKTLDKHEKLIGSLLDTKQKVEKIGGECLPIQTDIRSEEQVAKAISSAVANYKGLDIIINNASAIDLQNVANLPIKKYDLIHDINVKGTYYVMHHSLPYLQKSKNAHVITLSPPINLNPKWFINHTGYTQSKYAMSLMTIGFSTEYRNIMFNSIWPKTAIYTAAMEMLAGKDCKPVCRKPAIVSDAILALLSATQLPNDKKSAQNASKPGSNLSGKCFTDEEILREYNGLTDFSQYAYIPQLKGSPELLKDFFLD